MQNCRKKPCKAPGLALCIAGMTGLLLHAASLQADASPAFPALETGWLAFGDLYTVPSHHSESGQGASGLVMRRMYITFDADFSDTLFGRLRFEANQDGEFEEYGLDADFKDLYLGWRLGDHRLVAGLQNTFTFDVVEKQWGARYLMRTPLDLQGVASRDTGLSLKGPLGSDGRWSYRVLLGSNAEFGKDSDDASKLQLGLGWQPSPGWTVDFYMDYEDRSEDRDRHLLQAYIGHQGERTGWGLMYAHQDRESDPALELASLFVRSRISEGMGLIGRVDRLYEPSPKGDGISYIPFDPRAPATLYLAGIETFVSRHVLLTPNVVYIRYDQSDLGVRPESDLHLRLTLFLDFE
jgi:hypothetical protein